jgi:hypothetical protein
VRAVAAEAEAEAKGRKEQHKKTKALFRSGGLFIK